MTEPLVSAIITTHNRLELLKRAVNSVCSQTYKNIEIIVVDDASTDGTQSWCESQKFQYIRISEEESKGGNYARNIGASLARGKYLAYLDDDDYWMPEKTKRQVELLESSGNEVAHCGRIIEETDSAGEKKKIQFLPSLHYRGDLKNRILYQITILTSTMMISRRVFLDVGKFDEQCKFWQEYELSIRLAQRSQFELCNSADVVYSVDITDKNRLTNKYAGWIEAVEYIHRKHTKLYQRLNLWQKLRVKVLFWQDSSSRAKTTRQINLYYRHKWLSLVIGFPFRVWDKLVLLGLRLEN